MSQKKIPKRRGKEFVDRRKNVSSFTVEENRQNLEQRIKKDRRIKDLDFLELDNRKKERRETKLPDYTSELANKRADWVEKNFNCKLEHIRKFSFSPQLVKKNIENFVGAVQTPLSVVGPLLINGDYAKGEILVPFATTEATMTMTYQIGMRALNLAGGVNVKLLQDKMHISPCFALETMEDALALQDWVNANFNDIKKYAEAKSNHCKLLYIEPRLLWNKLILVFHFTTGDATGQNMTVIAAANACKFISSKNNNAKFYLKSNFSSDKKTSWYNYLNGYGKKVQATAVIPDKIIRKVLKTTAKDVVFFYKNIIFESSNESGMLGIQGQFTNGLAALFLATGQDMANVVHSSQGAITADLTKQGDFFVGVSLPSLTLGTVGGGTDLPTYNECLAILNCCGKNKSRAFAEICAAVCLAGEIGIAASLSCNQYAETHNRYRRK